MTRTHRGFKAAGAVAGAVLALTVSAGCDNVMPEQDDQEQQQEDGGGDEDNGGGDEEDD